MIWTHLSDIPKEIRQTLDPELERAEIEDRAIVASAIKAMREARLAMRVPHLCRVLRVAHPELPKRTVFIAVALITGLSEGHVKNTYYEERAQA
jgi:hypothetical protein